MKKITSLFLVLILSTSFTFAKIVYVNQLSGSDTNDGTNWAKAYKTLSYANNSLRTTTGDSIWVAGGANYILSAATANTSANSNSFYQNNKNWFGGFFGNENTLNQRPLSDRDGNGITESWEFLYPTVLSISLTDATAIVFGAGDFNGFTLTANATYTSRYNYVYALNASTRFSNNTIKNCIVTLTMASTANETYNPFFKARGIIDNCIFEKNEITVNAKNSYCYPFINIENSAAITSGTIFTNNIVRNNKVRIDYTTSTANSNSAIRGLILNIIPAIQSSGLNTTIANCCIHNNEMIYVPSVGNTSGATLTNGATISVNTQNSTACNDSIINCTIANNKGTKIKTGGIYIGFDAVSYHYIINNVFYNNQNSSDGSTFYVDNMSGSITANVGIISNNFTNGGGLINTANKIYNQDNTLNINSPVFLFPTMVSGNTSDNSTELSNWAIGPSSYLIGKGTSVNGRLTDKSGKIFQNPRTIGAYEFYMNCMVSASTLTSGGTIISGDGNYNYGTTVTLIAQPNPGFHFTGWTENTTLVSTNPTYSFNITGNRTFTASFLSNNVSIQSGITNISSYPNCESCSVELSGIGTILEINENASLNSLTVNPGSKVTLNSGKTLNLSSLLLRSDITGNATFVDNGSSNINTATVQQFLSSGRNWYIASPVNSAVASNLSSAASVVYYNEPSSTWLPAAGNSELIPGKGYISVGTNNTDIVTFSGTLNTGNISVPLTRSSGITNEGFNLVGNPYASYLDFTKVDTTTANILPTIWYRTKNLNSNSYVFDTYNGLANIGTSNGSLTVSNLIPPMQAFWVRVKPTYNSGTLTFNNGMRTHSDVLTNRLKFPKQNELKQSVLRLKIFKGQFSDETIIAFNELAKDDYDAYDSPKMMNTGSTLPEIYTTAGNELLAINSRRNPNTGLSIPLGFKTGEAGTFILKIEDLNNFSPENRIFIKDNNLNTEAEVTNNGEYTFSSGVVNSESRFSVIFKTSSTSTQIQNQSMKNISLRSNANKQILITNDSEDFAEIIVTNILGEQVLKSILNEGQNRYNLNKGVYIVTISQASDKYTQKVIVN